MADPRWQFRVLARHFLGGFLENDTIAPAGDMHGVLSKVVSLVLLPVVMYPFKLLFSYGYPFKTYEALDAYSWGDKSVFVLLSMVVMGLLTALEWDALQLDRRDSLIFGSLPIPARTVLQAKMTALAGFLLVLSAPLSVIGAITFPTVMHSRGLGGWTSALRTMAGHATATLAAAWFVFFLLLATRSGLQCVLGGKWARRASAAVQLCATLVFVVALLMLPFIASNTQVLKRAAGGAAGWAPHLWFLGIYQVIGGRADPAWLMLAGRGWLALGIAAASAAVTSLLAFRRMLGTSLEASQAGDGRPSRLVGLVNAVARMVARRPAERGFFVFAAVTITRSPWHRIVLAATLGGALALAMVTLDFSTIGSGGTGRVPIEPAHALAMQWVLIVIALAGIRAASSVPAELRANWALRLADGGDPRPWMSGFRKAMLTLVVGPLILVMAIVVWLYADWQTAARQAIVVCVFAALTFDMMFAGYGRVPFACAFDGASGEPKVRWYLCAALFTTLVVPIAVLVTRALESATGSVSLAATTGGLLLWMRWRERRSLARDGGLAFTFENPATQTLDLGP